MKRRQQLSNQAFYGAPSALSTQTYDKQYRSRPQTGAVFMRAQSFQRSFKASDGNQPVKIFEQLGLAKPISFAGS